MDCEIKIFMEITLSQFCKLLAYYRLCDAILQVAATKKKNEKIAYIFWLHMHRTYILDFPVFFLFFRSSAGRV